jgi:hypothetical protein
VRAACTSGEFRRITVHEHAETAAAARERMKQRPEIFARRQGLVEHCFGTLKFWMGHRAFLTRGLEMVRGEFSLSCLGYHLRRVLESGERAEVARRPRGRARAENGRARGLRVACARRKPALTGAATPAWRENGSGESWRLIRAPGGFFFEERPPTRGARLRGAAGIDLTQSLRREESRLYTPRGNA